MWVANWVKLREKIHSFKMRRWDAGKEGENSRNLDSGHLVKDFNVNLGKHDFSG